MTPLARDRLSRRRPHGSRHRGGVRLCRPRRHHDRHQRRALTTQFAVARAEALGEVSNTLASLARFGCSADDDADAVVARVSVVPAQSTAAALAERRHRVRRRARGGRPQARGAGARPRSCVGPTPIIASTTSTILVDDLSGAVEHPERFLNAHWLNPAYLIPLVEISPGQATDPAVTAQVKALLEGIGKVPVVCAAHAGLHRAAHPGARHERGGAHGGGRRRQRRRISTRRSRYGFGFRYAVMGLLEFIDWGGGDILYYAEPLSRGRAWQRPLSRAGGDLDATCTTAASACGAAPASSTTQASMSMPTANSVLRHWSICSGILGWQRPPVLDRISRTRPAARLRGPRRHRPVRSSCPSSASRNARRYSARRIRWRRWKTGSCRTTARSSVPLVSRWSYIASAS